MKLYRFSPVSTPEQLIQAIEHVHFACYELCKQSFNVYLLNTGNVGIFCHYDNEYDYLISLRNEMVEPSDLHKKYGKLKQPIVIASRDNVPETTYTHLYIRKPDPYRHHVGDIDLRVDNERYKEFKQSLNDGKIKGARIFPRPDLDMIELHSPDIDALGYITLNRIGL